MNLQYNKTLPILLFSIICNSVIAQNNLKLGFYNVENLFDTIDNPLTADDEFTPNGEKAYNSQRYFDKISKLSQVFANTKLSDADAIGLSEVENKAVLSELIRTKLLTRTKYRIIHFDSPDGRGIDCAMIYNAKTVKVLDSDTNRFEIKFADRSNTRDQLYVLLEHKKTGRRFNVFVNHWPSRFGGEEASRPKRILAAKELKSFIEEKKSFNDYPVVIMGDMNDFPTSESIVDVLEADTSMALNNKSLYNLSYNWMNLGLGTYSYKGQWSVLDQFIVSKFLIDRNGILSSYFAEIIKEDFMLYTDEKGNKSPSRSFGGGKYFGGYSDHLPILLTLNFK